MKKIQMVSIIFILLIYVSIFAENYSLNFDGDGDYVQIDSIFSFNNASGVSIGFWIKTDWFTTQIREYLFDITYSTGTSPTRYVLTMGNETDNDYLRFQVEGNTIGNGWVEANTSTYSNDWNFVTAVVNSDSIKLYLNSSLVASDSYSLSGNFNMPSGSNNLNIAAPGSAVSMFTQGIYDNFTFWTRDLNQNEIVSLMNGLLPSDDDLIIKYNFNEGSGSTLNDISSQGYDGTIYGATWSTDVPISEITTDFSANPTFGYFPSLEVNFTDESVGFLTNWFWDFQNDGTYDSFIQNPTFTYTNVGVYDVKLKVSNEAYVDSLIKNDYITVEYVPPAPPTNVEINISGNDAIIS